MSTKIFYKDYQKGFIIMSLVVAALGIPLAFYDAFLGGAMMIEGALLAAFYLYFAPKGRFGMLALPCFAMAAYQVYVLSLLLAQFGFKAGLLAFFMLAHAATLIMTALLAMRVYSLYSIAGIVSQILMLAMVALGVWWIIDGTWVLANTNYSLVDYLIYYVPYTVMLIVPSVLNIVFLRCFVPFKR